MESKKPKRSKEDDESALLQAQGSAYDPLSDNILYAAKPVGAVAIEDMPPTAKARPTSKGRQSQIHRMLTLFEEHRGEAFLSEDGKPFVSFVTGTQKQVLPLSAAVEQLSIWFYEATLSPMTTRLRETLKDHLKARAGVSPRRKIWLRVAEFEESLYLDLARDDGQVVKITKEGWELTSCPPIYFARSPGMQPLPIPVRGGSLDELFDHVNVPDTNSRALVLAWLVATLRPSVPCAILAIHGEKGCAKTTLARILYSVVDPQVADLRVRPKDEETVMVAARNAWILPYDNLSGIAPWLSDLLCCLSTGGSYTARQKYTDDGEVYFTARRPVILNGIEDAATRLDLIDRCILLYLPTIPAARRRPEQEVLAGFRRAHPSILGALLSAASGALRRLPHVQLAELPRMADFTRWAVAAESGLGIRAGAFLSAYVENRGDAHAQALDAAPLVAPIEQLMADRTEWRGSATNLLAALLATATQGEPSRPGWPKDPCRLSGALKRIATDLRPRGLNILFTDRETEGPRRRLITILKTAAT